MRWRDNNGLEADLLFETAGKLQPVEIKSGQTVTADYIRAGKNAARFSADETLTPWLIHGGDAAYERSGVKVFGWRGIPALVAQPDVASFSPGASRPA